MEFHNALYAVLFVSLIVMVLGNYQAYRLDKKEKTERKKRNEDFLKANEGITALVLFTDTSGKTHVSGTFTAKVEKWYRKDVLLSAEEVANEYLDNSMERGFFENATRERFPVCNITVAWVVEA